MEVESGVPCSHTCECGRKNSFTGFTVVGESSETDFSIQIDPESAVDLTDPLLAVLQCFGECEGTWYQGQWRHYGVTPEQERLIEQAHMKKYPA